MEIIPGGHGGLLPPIAALYEAAADPTLWPDAGTGIVRALGAQSGMFSSFDSLAQSRTLLAMPGISDDVIDKYSRHFHSADLHLAAVSRMKGSFVLLGPEVIPLDEWDRSEMWNDLSRPNEGPYHFLDSVFQLPGGFDVAIGLHRPQKDKPFEETDRRRFFETGRHIASAVQLKAVLDVERLAVAGQVLVLERLGIGAIVVTATGLVIRANPVAERLWSGPGLRLSGGRRGQGIQAAVADEQRRLLALIGNAASGGPGGSVRITRCAPLSALAVSVSTLPSALDADANFAHRFGLRMVLVRIRDIAAQRVPERRLLIELFGLTAAEAEVARDLCLVPDVATVARRRGVALATVRVQVRQILYKTGAANLRALVQLLERLAD